MRFFAFLPKKTRFIYLAHEFLKEKIALLIIKKYIIKIDFSM